MASASRQFVHLHLHTEYSLLDGGNRIGPLIDRVKALGMGAVAMTDHGNLHGAVAFYRAAKAAGIKPILGIEAYVAPDLDGRPSDRTSREYTGVSDGGFHLVLLAENQRGWANLLKLSSDAFIKGFYYKPRMDKTTLAQWADGLIAINGHLGSSLAHHLRRYVDTKDESHYRRALEEARWHAATFGVNERGEPRFYVELQRHIDEQERINPHLIRLARELGLPLVCDNDSHFLLESDWDAHDSLVCISTGKLKEEEGRLRYPKDLYVKGPQEMWALFEDFHGEAGAEAMANTSRIAERCNVELDFATNHAPVVKIEKRSHNADPSAIHDPQSAIGSTEWYKAFCSQYELHPFNAHEDSDSPEQLKRDCDAALRDLAEAGAIWRYGEDGITDEIRTRLDRELTVLADKSISAYFLIVWDFVNYARSEGIPANARGSGVGTMVGYCLGLSNACPVKYGLLFERFTDPDRSEYPDIDIDLCQDGRAKVISYVRQKYGHVAQIITFGTLKARAAIKDVGRVMGLPPGETQALANLVPDELKITLDEALEKEPKLAEQCRQSPQVRKLIDTARRLEGMARHASIHAAGVVVATQPLDNIIPLYRDPKSGEVVTQWDGPTVESCGLLKMDFLGLRTLSIIERAKQLIRATLDRDTQRRTIHGHFGQGPAPDTPREFADAISDSPNPQSAVRNPQSVDPLDLERLTYCDQNVLDLFRRGETAGVFQFESGGMRNTLIGMRPDRLEDLIAANALFRPGPMGLIDDYNDRKHARAHVPSSHPIVDRYTAETYGVMVYQEQVMQIIHELGDIPLREAYSIIKAISKKKLDKIAEAREAFVAGAAAKAMHADEAHRLFTLIEDFAGYGFNKSHSTGYAIVAYQTAYLKTYFPVQYMAALLTYESVNSDKVTEYMDECRKVRRPNGDVGIEVRPPDVNLSFNDFTVVYEDAEPRDPNHGHIRFGLSAVKGVGAKAVDSIIVAREKDGPFRSLFDFCERVPQTLVNKAVVEALIKCGAFDALHGVAKRSAMIAAVEQAMARGAQEANLRSSDDFLFGDVAGADEADAPREDPELPPVAPWSNRQTLDEEKAVLGLYVSSHPLHEHRALIDRFTSVNIRDAMSLRADTQVVVAGMISRVRQTVTRAKQEKMAILTLEDLTGGIDAVAFPRTFTDFAHLLQPERAVFLEGRIDRRREEPNLIIERVVPFDEAPEQLTRSVKVMIRDHDERGCPRHLNGELKSLHRMLRQMRGPAKVVLELHLNGHIIVLQPANLRVAPTATLPDMIAGVLGDPRACALLGPDKLVADINAEHAVTNRLARSNGQSCASIDRY